MRGGAQPRMSTLLGKMTTEGAILDIFHRI
jgi:hypothetical protein